jgi:hypothetical protein
MTTLMHHCGHSDCGNQYLRKCQYSTFISALPITLPDKTQTFKNKMGTTVKRMFYGPILAPLLQFHAGIEEDHGTHHSGQPLSRPKSETVTAQLNCKFQ